MAIKRRDVRPSHVNTGPLRYSSEKEFKLPLHPIKPKSPKVDKQIHASIYDVGLSAQVKKSLMDKKKTLAQTVVKCNRHPTENIKFIDITSDKLDTLCDLCITSPDYMERKIKLDRVVDLANKLRKDTIKYIEDLENYNTKLQNVNKEVILANATSTPIINQIDDMERKIILMIKDTFSHIRNAFTRTTPYKDVREVLKNQIEEGLEELKIIDGGDKNCLKLITKNLKDFKEIQQTRSNLMKDLDDKLKNATAIPLLSDKEFNNLAAVFMTFSLLVSSQCDKLLKSINHK